MLVRVTPAGEEPFIADLANVVVKRDIEAREIAEIMLTLTDGREYVGGGKNGAPFFTIRRIEL